MKAITWLAAVTVGVAAVSSATYARVPEGWSVDLEKSFKQAKEENKPLFVHFTGSDWCPPCIVMNKEVFMKKEFITEASKKFILVELDLPASNPELKEKNQAVADKYKVEGFPYAILFDKDGKEFDRFFAADFTSIDGFLKRLDTGLEKKGLD